MSISRVIRSSALVIFLIAVSVSALPVQIHGENDAVYVDPEVVEALARSYAALGAAGMNDDNIRTGPFARQSRRGLDSLSGATFGQSKRFDPRSSKWANNMNRVEVIDGAMKRNMDEIDRTGFDNFVKRNFDEIDRAGWDSFVKRNFAARQH